LCFANWREVYINSTIAAGRGVEDLEQSMPAAVKREARLESPETTMPTPEAALTQTGSPRRTSAALQPTNP
jgi:hypothetical protein